MTPRPRSEAGSSLLEAVVITSLILSTALGLLTAFYLVFAKAWIQYESEQTLYCLIQTPDANMCRRTGLNHMSMFLPWGKLLLQTLCAGRRWIVVVQFDWSPLHWEFKKQLTEKDLLKRRDLSW